MNFSDEEREKYEQQLAELDEKTLIIQQVTELAEIRKQLQLLNSQLVGVELDDADNGTDAKVCTTCNTEVPEDKLQSHAVEEHNAPPEMPVEDLGLFE